jgi:hypothetical protein
MACGTKAWLRRGAQLDIEHVAGAQLLRRLDHRRAVQAHRAGAHQLLQKLRENSGTRAASTRSSRWPWPSAGTANVRVSLGAGLGVSSSAPVSGSPAKGSADIIEKA